ncbi:MAG: HNH endonuclease [Acidobacteriota bacterium]|nr:HNH endonuclease [Acidobacteriota bacterium]
MSTARTMPGGRVRRDDLPKGPNGRALCRWCALEVPPRRITFCSEYCVDEWRMRTDPSYLRERIFERDRGVCAACGIDTALEWTRIRRLRYPLRLEALRSWGLNAKSRSSLWDADHVLPVVEGGGECDLSNIRTLCLKCHRKATAELRARLRGAFARGPDDQRL